MPSGTSRDRVIPVPLRAISRALLPGDLPRDVTFQSLGAASIAALHLVENPAARGVAQLPTLDPEGEEEDPLTLAGLREPTVAAARSQESEKEQKPPYFEGLRLHSQGVPRKMAPTAHEKALNQSALDLLESLGGDAVVKDSDSTLFKALLIEGGEYALLGHYK